MKGGTFGWDYPPGVTGNESHLTGEWRCVECDAVINDERCCQREAASCMTQRHGADHCIACCNIEGGN